MIAIIDYDAGNIRSVEKALEYLGQQVCITREPDKLLQADHVILPGVGAFGDAMNKLNQYQLVPVIREIVKKKIPFLGICLGLQLLFEESEEAPGISGLGLLPGRIIRIPDNQGLKVPHIGWNSLKLPNEGRLFKGISENSFVYFVHSFYLHASERTIVTATTDYATLIDASVEKDNVFGCQFHPETSSATGLQILKNFIKVS